jgi:cytochrome c oxidase cbb3-type subunit III
VSSTLSWYIGALVAINIAAAMWLLFALRRKPSESGTTTDTTGHVWDEDLTEYNNPLPRWWLWLFVLSVAFSIGYLVLYPGFGAARGTLGWSQAGQHAAQSAANEARIAQTLAPFADQSIDALRTNPAAMTVGRNLFANNCAACHGSDGRGALGFPNLADNDWLWGSNPDTIVETISNGRNGIMVPWGEALGAAGVEDVTAYVLSLSGRSLPAGNAATGQARFAEFCSVCHGADGKGNQELGAPNLTDSVWLHGGSIASIRATIQNGRENGMPAHADRLGDLRIRLLAAYVLNLSADEKSPQRQAAIDAGARAN